MQYSHEGLFPSEDGNLQQREEFLRYIGKLVTGLDALKDKDKLSLGEMPTYTPNYYNQLAESAVVPIHGFGVDEVIKKLLELSKGQRYVNSRYVANAAPLPNTASILGNLLMTLTNGNNLWDVEGSAGASAEVQIVGALSKIVGYDETQSSGYTTWGGQGAVFNSLRLAISRRFPRANQEGVPRNLYAFCSELSHYSLFKSLEAVGIGTNNLIRIGTNHDGSINVAELHHKMVEVIQSGGIPVYVLATMGSTDSFAVDDIEAIKDVLTNIEETHNQESIYLHADTAMGGMFTFFNNYSFEENPLNLEDDVLFVLQKFRLKFEHIKLADSMVFDFHKLGQTPYTTSLFLIRNKLDLQNVDLDASETPYVGNRGFGSYHTSYTLECSRAGSAIPIYASLWALGIEGYQKILANYISVNIAFRKALYENFDDVEVTNQISPLTTFRFYNGRSNWWRESHGLASADEIRKTNDYNSAISERLGAHRNEVYFGSTSKQCLLSASDSEEKIPLYVQKFFSISPYTTSNQIDSYIQFLKKYKRGIPEHEPESKFGVFQGNR